MVFSKEPSPGWVDVFWKSPIGGVVEASTVRANEKRDFMAEPLRLNWVDLNFRRTKVDYCQSAVWRPTVSLYICADSMYWSLEIT